MDIERWLQGTADAEEPDTEQNLDIPLFLQPMQGTHDQTKRHRRQRKHASSDSSLLQAEHSRKSRALREPCAEADGNRTRKSASATDQLDGEPCEDTAESEFYKRRPRRKTRPARYDPKTERIEKTKKTKPDKAVNGEEKEKKRRRTKIKERLDAGLAHSFRAKNVAKERLTLKPQNKLGVFKRGRASSPVRGRGVPDLTFSEMRFLQKRQDPGETEQENQPAKCRKSEAARVRQDEISAYFTAKRPVLAEQDVNVRTVAAAQCLRRATKPSTRSVRDASIDPNSPRATIELLDKPFPGFGSRAPPPQSLYYTWSESVRQPSALPYVPTALSPINVGALQQVQPPHIGAWNDSDEAPTHVLLPEKARSIGRSSQERTTTTRHRQKSSMAPSPQAGARICLDRDQHAKSSKGDRPKLRTGHPPPHDKAAASPAKRHSKASPSEPGQENTLRAEERNDGDYKQPKQSSSPLQTLLRSCDAAFSIPRRGGLDPPRSVEMNSDQRISRHMYSSRQPRAPTTHAVEPRGATLRSASPNVYVDQMLPQNMPDGFESQYISPWELKDVRKLGDEVDTTYYPLSASPYVANAYDVLHSTPTQRQPDEETFDGAITDAAAVDDKLLEDEGGYEAGFAGFWRPHRLY